MSLEAIACAFTCGIHVNHKIMYAHLNWPTKLRQLGTNTFSGFTASTKHWEKDV